MQDPIPCLLQCTVDDEHVGGVIPGMLDPDGSISATEAATVSFTRGGVLTVTATSYDGAVIASQHMGVVFEGQTLGFGPVPAPDAGRPVLDVETVLMDAAMKLYGSLRDAATAKDRADNPDGAGLSDEDVDELRLQTAMHIQMGTHDVVRKLQEGVRDRIRERRTRAGQEWREDTCSLPVHSQLCVLQQQHPGGHFPGY